MLKLELQTNIKLVIGDSFGGYLCIKMSVTDFPQTTNLLFHVFNISFMYPPKELRVYMTLSFKRYG